MKLSLVALAAVHGLPPTEPSGELSGPTIIAVNGDYHQGLVPVPDGVRDIFSDALKDPALSRSPLKAIPLARMVRASPEPAETKPRDALPPVSRPQPALVSTSGARLPLLWPALGSALILNNLLR